MTENPTPAEALEAIRQSRKAAERRVARGSWRYDLTYSAIFAAMIGSQALDMPINSLGVAGGLLALALLYRRETERLGVAVNGMTPRRARWVAIGLGLAMLPLMLAAIVLNYREPPLHIHLLGIAALSLVAFVFALVGSRLWLRVYRRETGTGE
ncbi:hypothetical protein GGQ87_003000 [Brevundimonas alba]|uniref:Transmembrane protein n=1 Tax=Brevundimonas alba TaxID=74314 RepID=A0A7X5YMJ3_9CAUL|nr:hypothetical protein [Brevundimonas alba]NJC42705.1 hypothetical protein [Brevundimonas alba]